MSKKAGSNLKCAAAAICAGGITFAAIKAMSQTKTHMVKKSTGKAIKAVGAVIDALQG